MQKTSQNIDTEPSKTSPPQMPESIPQSLQEREKSKLLFRCIWEAKTMAFRVKNPPRNPRIARQSSLPKTIPQKDKAGKKKLVFLGKTTSTQSKSKQNSSKTPRSQPRNRRKSQEKLDFLPTPPVAGDFGGVSRKNHRKKKTTAFPPTYI